MLSLTSSVIVTQALGLRPDGVNAEHEANCAYCGLHISQGDLYTNFFAGQSFMDGHSLASKGSPYICGHCAVLLSAKALRATGYGAFHAGGVMPFRKWVEIAAALTEPPPVPFVMCYATANSQHMAWRLPVNYSRDLYYVRVGLRDLKIRRPKLLAAVQTLQRMGEQIGRTPTEKTLAHPFTTLSNDLKDPHTTNLVAEVWKRCDRKDIQDILNLTTGELWALRFLLTPGAGNEDEEESDID